MHATTALKEDQGEDVIQAWLQAATTAEEMYTLERREVDKGIVDATARVANCLRAIAESVAQGQRETAALRRKLLRELVILQGILTRGTADMTEVQRAQVIERGCDVLERIDALSRVPDAVPTGSGNHWAVEWEKGNSGSVEMG
jgi:hypothetical protein